MASSPGNLSTSSSASSTLGSPENEEYILSFETIDKMRRVSSYSALNSLIGEPPAPASPPSTAQGTPRTRTPRPACSERAGARAAKSGRRALLSAAGRLGHFDSDLMAFDRPFQGCLGWPAVP